MTQSLQQQKRDFALGGRQIPTDELAIDGLSQPTKRFLCFVAEPVCLELGRFQVYRKLLRF